MINELEKQFFDTFGIKPKKGCTAYDKFTEEEADVICNDKCAECSYLDDVYPKIASDRLLELICILGSTYICVQDRETLKEHILVQCMNKQMYSKDIKYQVRTLFEEG